MRQLMLLTLVTGLCPVGFMGCSETASTEKKIEVTTPGGTTEVKTETTEKKTGENPPPAPNP